MTKRDRSVERMASDVIQFLTEAQRSQGAIELPTEVWNECERLANQIRQARSKDWHDSAAEITRQLAPQLNRLITCLSDVQKTVIEAEPIRDRVLLSDVYRDLLALFEEFPSVEYNRDNGELTVATEEIELEGMSFGAFEIVLECHQLGSVSPYRIQALDSRPASCCSGTIHPHVHHESLCEGEGQVLIERALRQGRLLDFFVIVRQILNTYNPSSAYVTIEDWEGVHCYDCGSSVDSHDCDLCHLCEVELCGECSCGCTSCDDRYCGNCVKVCEGCLDNCCQVCSRTCVQCEVLYCEECLTDDKCETCKEKEAEATKIDGAANTAVHAVCVGQAVVAT